MQSIFRPALELYRQSHALDYRGNFAYRVASWILIPCGRGLDSPYFSDRCDRGCNQACYRSRSVGVHRAWNSPESELAQKRPGPVTSELSPTNGSRTLTQDILRQWRG